MSIACKQTPHQAGSSMIEVLISLVILMLGLLGLVGLTLTSQRSEAESYQRAQALVLLQDMMGRINANRSASTCYAITTDLTGGSPYMGVGTTVAPACSAATSAAAIALADADLAAWNNLLSGASEVVGTTSLGAMVGARGCVSLDASGNYLITVVWQGIGKSVAPQSGLTCGTGLYGDEKQRRAVSLSMQVANLN